MRVSVNNELGYTELIIEESVIYEDDYQMRMLRECQLEGLVKVVGYGEDDHSQYIYDISGMQNVKQLYERESIKEDGVREICKHLLETMERVKEHMLDINKILLAPEFIFSGSGSHGFCYYPLNDCAANESFHLFTEDLVKVVDYDDVNAVRLVCGLHKCTMEEQYDLAEVLARYSEIEFEEKVQKEMKSPYVAEDIWTQKVEASELEDKARYNGCSKAENGEGERDKNESTYNIPWEKQVSGLLRETPLAKWWGEKADIPRLEGKVKVKRQKKEKWGDWEALVKEELPNR